MYYTPEVLALVKRLYAKDFKVFGLDPDLFDAAVASTVTTQAIRKQ